MKILEIKEDMFWSFKIFNRTAFYVAEWYGMILQVSKSKNCLTGGGTCLQNNVGLECMDEKIVKKCASTEYNVEDFYQSEINNGFFGVALMHGDNVIGYVCGSETSTLAWEKYSYLKPYFYVKYVWVAPEYRGRHYARFMISELSKQLNREFLMLTVRCNNKSAVHAYEQFGFEKLFYRKNLVVPLTKWNFVVKHQELVKI